jgi:CubicO group peptidase (beta-lactamase class C family)
MKFIALLCLTILAASSLARAGSAAGGAPDRIQAEIQRIAQRARVPGLVIAKVERGKIRWHEAFGERAPGEPLSLDTTFNVASLTKPVFSMATLQLVADRQLALDEKLVAYWSDPDLAGDARQGLLTPRLLLSHQSGLPNWRGDRPLAFLFDPGERQEYSGEGFEYLRRAIEQKTGTTLSNLLADKVFGPAGMRHTSAGWVESIGVNVAQGFDEAGKPIDIRLTTRRPGAAANLMTTIDDYAGFLAWVSRGAGVPKPLFAEMRRSQALQTDPGELFGLGWKLVPLRRETALLHDGRESGIRTWALVKPAAGEALVIFTNSSNGELVFRPLAKAALEDGQAVLASMDGLVWRYLQHLPAPALTPMSRGIARSPSFLSTLLHSVDTVLIQTSGLSRDQKALAAARVDEYVFARLEGKVDAERAEKLVARLLIQDGAGPRLRSAFDVAEARDWVEALAL